VTARPRPTVAFLAITTENLVDIAALASHEDPDVRHAVAVALLSSGI
jgi:hypothetical protein